MNTPNNPIAAGIHRPLRGRRILLGIGDGPSVPAARQVIRHLNEIGIKTQTILTQDALRWTTAEPFRVMTGLPPWDDVRDLSTQIEQGIPIEADAMLVVGATPRLCSRVIEKIPKDAVTIAMLSYRGPGLIIPAGREPDVEELITDNICAQLRQGGWEVPESITPVPSAGEIVASLVRLLLKESSGCPILVTAGPTREPVDPVRYISNRSSGRMGYAIAKAARDLGHPVTLVSGPDEGQLLPPGVVRIRIETAEEMLRELKIRHRNFPILIMAAAVADYRPREVSSTKIRRDRDTRELELVANADILLTLRDERRDLVTIGFAIEDGLDEVAVRGARRKLETKGLTFVVLNDPQRVDSAFGGGTNRARILWSPAETGPDRIVEKMPVMPKEELGRLILERAIAVWRRRSGA